MSCEVTGDLILLRVFLIEVVSLIGAVYVHLLRMQRELFGHYVGAECIRSASVVCVDLVVAGTAREHAGAPTKSNQVEKAVFVLKNHEIKVQK